MVFQAEVKFPLARLPVGLPFFMSFQSLLFPTFRAEGEEPGKTTADQGSEDSGE
ncbi:hypothetical protein PV341_26500 [Streptomyces sp. PA03-1a]|nr:hypothetical protein [Streptomyces sp. PA03-1a]